MRETIVISIFFLLNRARKCVGITVRYGAIKSRQSAFKNVHGCIIYRELASRQLFISL
jgi:hypothetical protein